MVSVYGSQTGWDPVIKARCFRILKGKTKSHMFYGFVVIKHAAPRDYVSRDEKHQENS